MAHLKASVIIPMYNAEESISELLEALKTQTERDFEVIIIDDGSKDNSFKAAKKIKTPYSLKIFRQENAGPAIARNNGAMKARAEILVFIDSDCIPREDFIEKIIAPFKNKETAGVQGDYETKNPEYLTARYTGYEIAYRHELMKNKAIDHIATYACAYRKKDFDRGFLGVFKKADMEDIELSFRIAQQKKKLVFSKEAKVKHPHQTSLFKFLKQQFGRGYWRVPGYKEHPEKIMRDSYLGRGAMMQGGLSLALLLSLGIGILLLIFSSSFFINLAFFLFLALYISNLPLGVYASFFEIKMLAIAPFIASLRSIAATLGFIYGFIYFKLIQK